MSYMIDHFEAIGRYVEMIISGAGIVIVVWKIFQRGQAQTIDLLRAGQEQITKDLKSEMAILRKCYKKDLKFIKKELRRRVTVEKCEQLRAQCLNKKKDEHDCLHSHCFKQ